jgi:hypothetical protein
MDVQHARRRFTKLPSTLCEPHLVPHETSPAECEGQGVRTNLLYRLKNSRSKHCHYFCQCYQKLYPPPKWHFRLNWPLSRGPCFYASEVDICPCFSIKFPDLRHLIDLIKSQKDGLPSRQEDHHYMFHNLRLTRIRAYVDHCCAFTQHPLVKIHVTTTFWIDKSNQSLRVITCYALRGSQGVLSQILANPKALTHSDIGKWLRKLFDEAGSGFAGWHQNSYFLVSSNRPEMREGHEPSLLEIITTRNLGDGQWPNRQWKINAHS